MDFFQQQDQARRNTIWLVVLLALAIASLIAITTLLAAVLVYYFQFQTGTHHQVAAFEQSSSIFTAAASALSWQLLGYITLAVGAVVALGSLYKLVQLGRGGRAVAEAMGGRLLNINTRDANERRILNVVEEMAIASGTPVPPVYLIEDDSINAFAAGYQSRDAVIGITRGCIQLLNRDELQGVIAHEFSHVLHGDMRLNIRLVGLLHGILVIGLIGYFLMRSAGYGRLSSSRRSNNTAGLFFLGLALMIIGYAGTFFGNIIKAAVSRQREFLADASAVQFTRNPLGIGGALKKIGGYSYGSLLSVPAAAEFSHMYFGQGVKTALGSMMATHPPLQQRIARIDPNWDGQFPAVAAAQPAPEQPQAASAFAAGAAAAAPVSALASIGNPGPAHMVAAQKILTELPAALTQAAHDPFSARALVYSLLLSPQAGVRQRQTQRLRDKAHPAVFRLLQTLAAQVATLDDRLRLPLLELTIPALKVLSEPQYEVFKHNLVALIRADDSVDLFEWSLYRIVVNNTESKQLSGARTDLKASVEECRLLLSCMAKVGHEQPQRAQQAFNHGAAQMGLENVTLLSGQSVKLQQLDRALEQLARLKPLQKPLLLKGLAGCITHDGKVKAAEAELFRAIADSLDCPVPPLLPDQQLV